MRNSEKHNQLFKGLSDTKPGQFDVSGAVGTGVPPPGAGVSSQGHGVPPPVVPAPGVPAFPPQGFPPHPRVSPPAFMMSGSDPSAPPNVEYGQPGYGAPHGYNAGK